VAKPVNNIKRIKSLEKGYYLIEWFPRHEEFEGGKHFIIQENMLIEERRLSHAV
jgi:hypothetical protein